MKGGIGSEVIIIQYSALLNILQSPFIIFVDYIRNYIDWAREVGSNVRMLF